MFESREPESSPARRTKTGVGMSRKLDALVAEKVMGHENDVVATIPAIPPHNWIEPPGQPRRAIAFAGFEPPHYSTDIAAAWEVVEKIKNTHEWSIENDQGEINEWLVSVTEIERQPGVLATGHCAEAPTAPHAICLAALKACGVPESQVEEAMK